MVCGFAAKSHMSDAARVRSRGHSHGGIADLITELVADTRPGPTIVLGSTSSRLSSATVIYQLTVRARVPPKAGEDDLFPLGAALICGSYDPKYAIGLFRCPWANIPT